MNKYDRCYVLDNQLIVTFVSNVKILRTPMERGATLSLINGVKKSFVSMNISLLRASAKSAEWRWAIPQ